MSDQQRSPALAKMTVAITGANGFIGARAVDMLASLDEPPRVRLLTRRKLRGGRDCAIVKLDDRASVKAALDGCDAVIHCAFDFNDMPFNRRAALVLGEECAAIGARLVHVSTAAVHEPFPDGDLDEETIPPSGGSEYKHVKRAIENELLGLAGKAGLEVVILQPAVVYGPFGRAWTDSPVRELLTGTVVLPEDGLGLCNAVYVDDVCQAVIASLTAPLASGERILVSGPAPVTWKAFYGAYQDMLHLDALRPEPAAGQGEARSEAPTEAGSEAPSVAVSEERGGTSSNGVIPSNATRLKTLVSKFVGGQAMARMNLLANFSLSLVLRRKIHGARGAKLALFRSRCHIRIDKARRLLAYQPRFDLATGMQSTTPYIVRSYGRLARIRGQRPSARSDPRGPEREAGSRQA